MARPNYFTTMKNFALQQPSEDWMILEFSQLGFIGESEPSLRFKKACTVNMGKCTDFSYRIIQMQNVVVTRPLGNKTPC